MAGSSVNAIHALWSRIPVSLSRTTTEMGCVFSDIGAGVFEFDELER